MAKKMTPDQRQAILRLLAQGQDRETIAAAVDVTPGQVSAVLAHVKMGTYALPNPDAVPGAQAARLTEPTAADKPANVLELLQHPGDDTANDAQVRPILLGSDAESGKAVYWNPDPASGTANPHVLILGESGTGKTYAIGCLTAELAQQGIVSIVFDYG